MNTPDFENLTPQNIIVDGKAEWLKNAPWTYDSDAINVWEEEISPRLQSACLKEIDVEDLRLYCPIMLGQLKDAFRHDHLEDINQALKNMIG